MVTPSAANIVLMPFPFSDLSEAKLRPAVVIADASRGDWIRCQITSRPYASAITLTDDNFTQGSLRVTSYARPGKLFTASASLIAHCAGTLNQAAFEKIVNAITGIVRSGLSKH